MISFLKEELDRKSIFVDESKLGLDFVPDKLIHRDAEMRQLAHIFLPLLKSDAFSAKNAIITGPNGAGKTALSKSFGISIEGVARDFEKHIKYIHINCRINRSNYLIIKKIIGALNTDVPEKGYSIYELISLLKKILDSRNMHVIVTLDEMNFLNMKEDNLVYMLNRLNDDSIGGNSRVSIIGIVKNMAFIQYLDLSTLSSFQYNIVTFPPYTADQLFDILQARAKVALQDDAYTDDILHFISKIAAKNGDMRYSLEILYKAGKHADCHGFSKITPECIRHAQDCTRENIDINSLKILTQNEKLVLLSACRALIASKSSSVPVEDLKAEYHLVCEEYAFELVKKSQFYIILARLKQLEYITMASPVSRKRGDHSTIGMDTIPAQVLEAELLKQLRTA
ncbi:MAG: AAA family ATPase [Candidatus Lokiarchaeota archaeon]|nr:AAA family ATPase [Candidatus Lokiarchaeota archaeon]